MNVSKNSGDSKDAQVIFNFDGTIVVAWLDKSSSPPREFKATGVYAVFAKESSDGVTFSSPAVILTATENNLNKDKNDSLLQLDENGATWDPGRRR